MDPFEIFIVTAPGLEQVLCDEVRAAGFTDPQISPGGVAIQGLWPDVWRTNLTLRCASRVLARIGSIRVMHLAQLDKRARKFAWGDVLRTDVAVKVDVTCRKSRIYHAGAAQQRIETALRESHGITIAADAPLRLMARIEDDLCTFSLDTSGDALHIRGHKAATGKAPMRENLAAGFLHMCGYDGAEPVLDPMCGSGTFLIESAEIAAGVFPGRSRSFGFEQLASFDVAAWQTMKADVVPNPLTSRFFGSDRDDGAIRNSRANAERAGVSAAINLHRAAISDLQRPEGPPGLVIVNPPYGARIGERKLLFGLYGALGKTLLANLRGWRVGIVTSDTALARATGLPFQPNGPTVTHGGLRVTLHQTPPLR
jgi:putative N6-adenine-specific DNA methylase